MKEKKKKKIQITLLIVILLTSLAVIIAKEIFSKNQIRLLPMLVTKSLGQIKYEYSKMSCTEFTKEEMSQGYFLAFVTGYCRPGSKYYTSRHSFLCSVALNCSCPNGRNPVKDCSSGTMTWGSCYDFNESTMPYCNATASAVEPKTGHIAADWNCFEKNSMVNIDGKNYKVTDKGGAIKGRRFDIWYEDCADAYKATGIYKVR